MIPSDKSERTLRKEMLRFGHMLYERHLLVAMDGNLSCVLPDGDILCTQAGCHKGLLEDRHLVVIDRQGNKLRGQGTPTSEMAMHLACYQERPDCKAVIHAHPPLAIAFTIADRSLAQCVLPEVVLTLGSVPTVAYQTTGTRALADSLRPYVQKHDAVLMDRHGALTLGSSLLDAFCKLETLEHTAKITATAISLGGIKTLPAEEAVVLRSMGLKRYGGPPSAVAQADSPGADLPEHCLACDSCQTPSAQGIAPPSGLSAVRVKHSVAAGLELGEIRQIVLEELMASLKESP